MKLNPLGAKLVPAEKKIWAQKYPLKLEANQITKPTPIIMGIPWFDNFDTPVQMPKDKTWWVGLDKNNLGSLRGGHCACLPDDPAKDLQSWFTWYDQCIEGLNACVGCGTSRAMSLLNRKMYDWKWLWNEAKKIDAWSDTNPGDNEGTSVAAAIDILRTQGHKIKSSKKVDIKEGVVSNVWATKTDQLFTVLGNAKYKKLGAIPFLNNWKSANYPRVVWMPAETHEYLLQDGWSEYTMFVDR